MTIDTYLRVLFPELCLIVAGVICLFLGLSAKAGVRRLAAPWAFFSTMVVMVLMVPWGRYSITTTDFEVASGLAVTSLTIYVRLITLLVGAVLLLVNWYQPHERECGEYFSMVLFSMVGVMLVAASNDLILLFFALELVSVPTYVLVALSRRDIRAQEASGKYFFLGALAAALTAYGLSFLYGVAGTTTMFGDTSIATTFAQQQFAPYTLVGVMLVFGGLCFKIAAFPFHVYVADVYQGAAAPLSGLLGYLPKLAGFVGLIQLFLMVGWSLVLPLQWMVWIVAVLTMTVGNVLALRQTNVKRMLAYSSVAHSGYMLIGLLVGPGNINAGPLHDGLSALLFYILVYGLMNLGAFAALAYLSTEDREVEEQEQLWGLSKRQPLVALALTICMFSLMGLPPTAGFLGKVYLFSSAFSASSDSAFRLPLICLVVIAVLNTAVAAAYYLRVVGVCYLRVGPEQLPPRPRSSLQIGTAVCALLMIIIFAAPRIFMEFSSKATAEPQSTSVGGY